MAACRALMYLNFRISTSRIPYNMREAELGSHPVAGKRRLSSDLILWFGPGGAHSPVPAASIRMPARAAAVIDGASGPRRLANDRREDCGTLVRHGTSRAGRQGDPSIMSSEGPSNCVILLTTTRAVVPISHGKWSPTYSGSS